MGLQHILGQTESLEDKAKRLLRVKREKKPTGYKEEKLP